MSEATDVYSLGVVLYEMLTGELPFSGDNFVAVALAHINETPPSVLEKRPDVPERVADAVDRALAKDPGERWPTMTDFCRELDACLQELRGGTGGGSATVVIPPPRKQPRAPRQPRARPRWAGSLPSILVLAGLVVLAVALGIVLTRGGGGNDAKGKSGTTITTPVALSAVASWDPFGSNHTEHPERVQLATDGNPQTYWETEDYNSSFAALGKPGVGIILDASRVVTLHRVVVKSNTPGFKAVIRAGDGANGPFHDVSSSQTVGSSTGFDLSNPKARYFVVWITDLGNNSQVHVNEVTAG